MEQEKEQVKSGLSLQSLAILALEGISLIYLIKEAQKCYFIMYFIKITPFT